MAINPFPIVAREGWSFILSVALVLLIAIRLANIWVCVSLAFLLVVLILLFRDPRRRLPPLPLGILAPVDGRILRITPTNQGQLRREAMLIEMSVNHFGAYTARSPAEGKVLDLRDNVRDGSRLTGHSGLWVRTDEGDDVVVLMIGNRWVAKPRCIVGYGERVGQGRRFAFSRLARRVEIYIPLSARIDVRPGQRVRAGEDVLASFVRHDAATGRVDAAHASAAEPSEP
ncbi:MAG: hypothetical protein AAF610_15540 [Pseudomonadota bacterium]